MAQLTLKEVADKYGKSTLDLLQILRAKNISYERRQGDIFIDDKDLIATSQEKASIPPVIIEAVAQKSPEPIAVKPQDDIPEIFPSYGTDVIIPETRKRITEQKRTNRIKVWIDYDAKEKIERRFNKIYSRDKSYIAIPIASDLVNSCHGAELESLLNSVLPDKDETDNRWIKDAAIKYSRVSLEKIASLKTLLKNTRRLINAAYELRHDVDSFSITMFLEHERRPLIDKLQDYYRSFTEAILVYQKITPELKEEIFRLQNSSANDYELVLGLGQETFDLMRVVADRK